MTGSRGTWIRRDRRLPMDRKFRRAPVYLPLWAEQVWCIAADEGERDGDDVVVAAQAVEPAAVLDDLPDAWTDEMAAECHQLMMDRGMVQDAGDGLVRVSKVGSYNADRFRRREKQREARDKKKSKANGEKRAGTCGARDGHVPEEQEQEQEETLRVSLPATPAAHGRAETPPAEPAAGSSSGSATAEPPPPARPRCPNCDVELVTERGDVMQRCIRHGEPALVGDVDRCPECNRRSPHRNARPVPCQPCQAAAPSPRRRVGG